MGLDPTRIGGGIGITVAQLLQINTDFLYVDRSEGLAQLSGNGTVAISGINIGSAYIDYWTDGYFAFGGILGYGYPSLAHPTVAISGGTDFYIEAQPDGSYRSQGDGRLDVTVYFIHGVARMFFNNDWMAGCLQVLGVGLSGAHNLRTGETPTPAIGCDLSAYAIEPSRPRPSGRPSASRESAQAAPDGRTISVAEGERALVLSVKGTGGAPQLVLIGPDGHRYVPTGEAAKPVRDGTFTASSCLRPTRCCCASTTRRRATGDWSPSRGRRRSNR